MPGFVKVVQNKVYFKWYQVKFKRKQIHPLCIIEVMFISMLSAEIFRQLWSCRLNLEPWLPHQQMVFAVHWVDWWQLPYLALLPLGCHIQWHPYLLGQTWHAFHPRNWERSTSVRVISTSSQPNWSEDCQEIFSQSKGQWTRWGWCLPWDLMGPSSKNLWVFFAYTKAQSMPSHKGSGPSTCWSWDFHDHHPREERTFLQDIWPLPSSLLLTSNSIRAVHSGEPLATMTTSHKKLGNLTAIIHRAEYANPQKANLTMACHWKPEPQDPRLLTQTLHCNQQTSQILMLNQGKQTFKYTMSLPFCQPWKTYQAEDIGLSPFNPWHAWLPIVTEIWMLLLLLVGLLASGNLTKVLPLYCMLLEVS